MVNYFTALLQFIRQRYFVIACTASKEIKVHFERSQSIIMALAPPPTE